MKKRSLSPAAVEHILRRELQINQYAELYGVHRSTIIRILKHGGYLRVASVDEVDAVVRSHYERGGTQACVKILPGVSQRRFSSSAERQGITVSEEAKVILRLANLARAHRRIVAKSQQSQYQSRITERKKREQERAASAARLQVIRATRRAKIAEVLRYGGNAFGSYAGTVYERTSA